MTGALLLLLSLVSRSGPETTIRLEWTDPQGRHPKTHVRWMLEGHGAILDGAGVGMVARSGFTDVVDVVVNAELYPSIVAELNQYSSDLVAAGYGVRIDTMRGLSHVTLRTHLAGVSQLVGALLVGELPVAWYERGWGGGQSGEEFPIDLYYMDLDGTWTDSDADGLYDGHAGNMAPEIWVGRLYARPLTWDDEVRLMRRYFAKNHLYRTGGLSLPDRGLTYVDDDWAGQGDCYLGQVYSDVTVVDDGGTTSASDYRTRLAGGYEWIHICAHSSPWGHTFRVGGGYGGTVFNTEVYAIRPHAHFYNLFACSGTRFVEENYSAGWDIFQDDYGLAAVGSSKTGSMLSFGDFYQLIGQGQSIGAAFRSWFAIHGEESPDWFYGMNIIGDPTLKPHGGAGEYGHGAQPVPSQPTTAEVVCTHPETDDSPALLAMPDGKVWALWKSGRSPTNGRFDIFAAVRSNGSWSEPYGVGTAYYWETDPALCLDRNDKPVAVWSLFTDDYYYNLYYSVWNGTSWSTAQQVSDDCSSDMAASLARDSAGTLWCFWTSRRDLFPDVFAASYNGSSWTAPANVTQDSTTELHARAAAMPDSTLWVTYTRYRNNAAEIWARYHTGQYWTETGPISGQQRRAYHPAMTVGAGGWPIVCWQSFDSGNGDIYYSQYDGGNWSAPAPVDTDTALDVRPAMATDIQSKPWVVWMSARSGEWDIQYSYSEAGHWTPAHPVEVGNGPDMNPAIATGESGDVWITWQNLTGGNWDLNARLLPLTGCEEPSALTSSHDIEVRPNPFSGVTRIVCTGRTAGITVSDAAGRVVQLLRPDASGIAEWDGAGFSGRRLSPGVYFLRIADGRAGPARKVLLVR